MEITLGEPIAWSRSGVRMGTGTPLQWEVNGLDGVFVYLLSGIEDRYYITDEGRNKPASEHPWYPTADAALDSLRSRGKAQ